jgi:HSP20 family protein
MAKLVKSERKPEVELSRPVLPGLAGSLMERMDEVLSERWGWWPALRWHEEMARVPPVDVYEEQGVVVAKVELPGLRKEDVEVTLEGDLLTVSGVKEREERVERKSYSRYERHAGAFSRTVTLPCEVVMDQATARLEGGLLEIRAPRAEGGKATRRKIEVG